MRHQNKDRFSGRPARLRDVADAAGVSTATASRALTFPDRVRDDTRERVMEAARRLGYTPNEAARTLRAGASRMVLALLPQRCSEVFFAGVLAGMDQELSSHGYTMIMGSLEGNDVRARRLSDLVFAHHLDGVMVLTPVIPRLDGRSILEAGVPVVSICAEIDGMALQAVVIDDESCAVAQTEHLIGLGHRRLLYVAGVEGNYNEVHRYRGFLRAAAAAGLDDADLLRLPGDYSLASGVAAAQAVLSLKTRPTGVVCASDEMAIGFIKDHHGSRGQMPVRDLRRRVRRYRICELLRADADDDPSAAGGSRDDGRPGAPGRHARRSSAAGAKGRAAGPLGGSGQYRQSTNGESAETTGTDASPPDARTRVCGTGHRPLIALPACGPFSP